MGRPEWASLWVMLGNRIPRWRGISSHKEEGAPQSRRSSCLAGDASTTTFSQKKSPRPGARTPGFVLPKYPTSHVPRPELQPLGEGLTQRNWRLPSHALGRVPPSNFTRAPTGEGTFCSAGLDQLPDLSKVGRSEVWRLLSSQLCSRQPDESLTGGTQTRNWS